jgi:hypothetical protein
MRKIDRLFGCLMFLGGIGHGFGSLKVYGKQPMTLLWALSASLAVFLLAAVNLLRTAEKPDQRLAWICAMGCLAWVGFAMWFGVLIGNVFDFRPLLNAVIALVLAVFSFRTVLQAKA